MELKFINFKPGVVAHSSKTCTNKGRGRQGPCELEVSLDGKRYIVRPYLKNR